MAKTKAIIPCAGFGTRMGMWPDESKEMLKDDGNYIIDYSLNLCKSFDLEPLIITRKEKKDLKKYIKKLGVESIDIEVEGEWYNSVLKSESHWSKDNILILPDTRFNSINVIKDIKKGLELGNNAVLALHKVDDPTKWGIVHDYAIWEKPFMLFPKMAWGLIGFKQTYGYYLFDTMSSSSVPLENVGFTYLKSFIDITRGKNG